MVKHKVELTMVNLKVRPTISRSGQQWSICNGCDVIVEVLDGLFVVHLYGLGVSLGLEPQVGDG